jgi:hypothetical protein
MPIGASQPGGQIYVKFRNLNGLTRFCGRYRVDAVWINAFNATKSMFLDRVTATPLENAWLLQDSSEIIVE